MTERRAIPVYPRLEGAAEAMSVAVKTIRRWIAAGTLPACRCGLCAIEDSMEREPSGSGPTSSSSSRLAQRPRAGAACAVMLRR